MAALEQSIQEQLAENSRGDDENSRRDFGKLEARLVELLAPFERMVTRVVNDVQTIHELLLESSRGDAEKSRWDVENAQSARAAERTAPVQAAGMWLAHGRAKSAETGANNRASESNTKVANIMPPGLITA